MLLQHKQRNQAILKCFTSQSCPFLYMCELKRERDAYLPVKASQYGGRTTTLNTLSRDLQLWIGTDTMNHTHSKQEYMVCPTDNDQFPNIKYIGALEKFEESKLRYFSNLQANLVKLCRLFKTSISLISSPFHHHLTLYAPHPLLNSSPYVFLHE